jgi:hypothetical protein
MFDIKDYDWDNENYNTGTLIEKEEFYTGIGLCVHSIISYIEPIERKNFIKSVLKNPNEAEACYLAYCCDVKEIEKNKIKFFSIKGYDFLDSDGIIDNLPSNVTHLYLDSGFFNLGFLPDTIKHLTIYLSDIVNLDNLPNSIEYLEILRMDDNNFDSDSPMNCIPDSIKILKLGPNMIRKLKKLPLNIKKLIVECVYDRNLSGIPNNILDFNKDTGEYKYKNKKVEYIVKNKT